ncbi:MAG: hypothetical protein ABW202_20995 [Duganella sp.]
MGADERPLGYTWLIKAFNIATVPLSHASYIGVRASLDTPAPGVVHEFFPPNYWPGDDPIDHLVFALKYDDFKPGRFCRTQSRTGKFAQG